MPTRLDQGNLAHSHPSPRRVSCSLGVAHFQEEESWGEPKQPKFSSQFLGAE